MRRIRLVAKAPKGRRLIEAVSRETHRLTLEGATKPTSRFRALIPDHESSLWRECVMSAGWYYMASGWLRKARRVGPISEADLLDRIDKGKISPETLLQSSKTKGKWVPMNSIGPAMKRWKELHPEEQS